MVVHMFQVLWLDDERAVDFLIDLLPADDHHYHRMRRRGLLRKLFGISMDQEAVTGRWALGMLNDLARRRVYEEGAKWNFAPMGRVLFSLLQFHAMKLHRFA